MSRADSDIAEVETVTLRTALQRLLDLSDGAVAELLEEAEREVEQSVSLHDFTRILHRQQTKEEKRRLVKLLWEVAYADGEVDPQEELLVRKVSGLLYLTQEEFIEAKRKARASFEQSP